jgi:hypothetical protein
MNLPGQHGDSIYKKLIDNYGLLLETHGETWLKEVLVGYATRIRPPIPHARDWAERIVQCIQGGDEATFSNLFGPAMYGSGSTEKG